MDQCGFDLGLRAGVSYGVVCTYVHDTVCICTNAWLDVMPVVVQT